MMIEHEGDLEFWRVPWVARTIMSEIISVWTMMIEISQVVGAGFPSHCDNMGA